MDEIKPFSESISTGHITPSESFGDIRVTSSPLGKFTPEKKKQLEKKGFSKKDIEDIEKLRKQPPAIGFTRFTNPNDWIAGGDAWNSITELGFVDIDGKGNMHPAIPAYGEDGEDNIFDYQILASDIEDGNQDDGKLDFNLSFLDAEAFFDISETGMFSLSIKDKGEENKHDRFSIKDRSDVYIFLHIY